MAVKTAKQACEQLQGVEYFVDASNIVGRSVNDLVKNDERFVRWSGPFGKHVCFHHPQYLRVRLSS